MHLYAWLLPNVRLKGKNFIDICLIYKEIIKNIFLSRLLETGLFEKKKKKDLTMTSLAYSPFPIFLATSWEIFSFSCTVNRSMEFV